MTEFVFGVLALSVLCCVMLLRPQWFQRRTGAANGADAAPDGEADWYRLRSTELADSNDEELLREAALRVLEDRQTTHTEVMQPAEKPLPLMVLPVLVLVLAAVMYWRLGGVQDVQIYRGLQQLSENSSEQEYLQLIEQIEKRVQHRPDNFDYQAILGRYYMSSEKYDQAASLYGSLAMVAPNDAATLAMAAQAAYMAEGRVLSSSAQMMAEQAIAVDPHERTALGLLGMASYEKAQYQAAIGYWQRLLAIETPGSSSAQMIESVIARAQQALGGTKQADLDAASGPAVVVELGLAEGVTVEPNATVFVFARNANSDSRMPIVVKRLRVEQLPTVVVLDDAAAMTGQKISTLEQVMILARVSPGGMAGEEFASHVAEMGPVTPDTSGRVQKLLLKPRS